MNATLTAGNCQHAEGLQAAHYREQLKQKLVLTRAKKHGIGLGFAKIPSTVALFWTAEITEELSGVHMHVLVAGSAEAANKYLNTILRGEA